MLFLDINNKLNHFRNEKNVVALKKVSHPSAGYPLPFRQYDHSSSIEMTNPLHVVLSHQQ
jgi:hypothetical protein